jgi:hypothetical protein
LLPTPQARDGAGAHSAEYIRAKMAAGHGMWNLPDAVSGSHPLWPTPSASLGEHGGLCTPAKGREGGTLIEAVSARLWPTPTARDWRSGASNLHEKNSRPLNEGVHRETPGPLNPTWVEWLMGFPLGWTDLGA